MPMRVCMLGKLYLDRLQCQPSHSRMPPCWRKCGCTCESLLWPSACADAVHSSERGVQALKEAKHNYKLNHDQMVETGEAIKEGAAEVDSIRQERRELAIL